MFSLYYRHLDTENFRPALTLIDSLLKELRRLDDKMILTEVHLLESRVYRGLNNYPKAKVREVIYPSLLLRLTSSFLVVGTHFSAYRCQLDILPTTTPSTARLAKWNSSRRR